MTVYALLEPLTSPLFRHRETSASGYFPLPEDADCLWAIRITGWRDAWGTPPPGVVLEVVNADKHAVGRLTLAGLSRWIEVLVSKGLCSVAEIIREALQKHHAPDPIWHWGDDRRWCLDFTKPRIMGIVNVTSDSFSGDGFAGNTAAAVSQGVRMAAEGAHVIDVGGESTRPGAHAVSVSEELARVVPVVRELSSRLEIPVSVDTVKYEVMEAALAAGAALINDVTALGDVSSGQNVVDPKKIRLVSATDTPVILMHMQGSPATMQEKPAYGNVLAEVYAFLAQRIQLCTSHGIHQQRLMADPGIGFGKTLEHNLDLLRRQRIFRGLGVPLLLGISRKKIVAALTREPNPARRDAASHLLAAFGFLAGARLFRVHDVQGAHLALAVAEGWLNGLEETT